MNLAERIASFEMLADKLQRYHEEATGEDLVPLLNAATKASALNPWFTPEHVRIALNNLGKAMTQANLHQWISPYKDRISNLVNPKKIGVVMAGNIPAVGFHDLLCVLMSGHKLMAKLSSSDDQLLPALADILTSFMPEWQDYISFTKGKLENFDAIIATGNSNTSRYFEYYFSRYPNIIRRNRNSIAVLNEKESMQDLQNLADDIMLYFGMGCRSISKVYVPSGYNFTPLIQALASYDRFADHNKYRNNYDYSKSIYMVSQVPFIDTGFLLLKDDPAIASRIAVLHYEYYDRLSDVSSQIKKNSELIQGVISNTNLNIRTLNPGEGQIPPLWEYADQTDTMDFLLSLK